MERSQIKGENPSYIGDGVYAGYDPSSGGVYLSVERIDTYEDTFIGRHIHWMLLEPSVLTNLGNYIEQQQQERQKESTNPCPQNPTS